jgi:hypothetical protein
MRHAFFAICFGVVAIAGNALDQTSPGASPSSGVSHLPDVLRGERNAPQHDGADANNLGPDRTSGSGGFSTNAPTNPGGTPGIMMSPPSGGSGSMNYPPSGGAGTMNAPPSGGAGTMNVPPPGGAGTMNPPPATGGPMR